MGLVRDKSATVTASVGARRGRKRMRGLKGRPWKIFNAPKLHARMIVTAQPALHSAWMKKQSVLVLGVCIYFSKFRVREYWSSLEILGGSD